MKIDLSGKTAIVTGSTAGIGFAIAKGLAEAGATVVVNGRKAAALDKAVATLASAVPGAKIRGVAADVGSAEGCAALLEAEPSADILVNNVGIYGPQDFFDTPDEEWQRFFDVNVMSGVRLSRAYLPGMLDRNWGRVVFISSEVWPEHPGRHDPLRLHQNGKPVGVARPGQAARRNRCHRQRRPAGSDADRRRGGYAEGRRAEGAASRSPRPPTPSCGASAQLRSSSESRPWTRSPTWSSMSVRRRRLQPPARRCASMAARSTPSPELRSRPACRSRRRGRSGSGNIRWRQPPSGQVQ